MNNRGTEEEVGSVEWDFLEDRYIDLEGNTYKTLEDIPQGLFMYLRPFPSIPKRR